MGKLLIKEDFRVVKLDTLNSLDLFRLPISDTSNLGGVEYCVYMVMGRSLHLTGKVAATIDVFSLSGGGVMRLEYGTDVIPLCGVLTISNS